MHDFKTRIKQLRWKLEKEQWFVPPLPQESWTVTLSYQHGVDSWSVLAGFRWWKLKPFPWTRCKWTGKRKLHSYTFFLKLEIGNNCLSLGSPSIPSRPLGFLLNPKAFHYCCIFAFKALCLEQLQLLTTLLCSFMNWNKIKQISTGYIDVRSEDEVPIFRRQRMNFR